jgi:ribosomal protein S17E
MFFSSAKKTESDLFLVIDIGGGSVGGALVLIAKGEVPKIISSKRLNSSFSYLANDDKKIISSIDKPLDEILTFFLKQAGHDKIKHISCVLSSPWCQIRTRTFKLPNNEPVTLTKNYLDKLLTEEKKYFEKDLDVVKNNFFAIESKIVQTKINGYETANPYNKKGKDIEVSSYFSFANKDFIRVLEDSFFKHFHIKKAGVYSFFLMYFNVLGKLYPESKDYSFADIREESTDVSVVKDGMLGKTETFNLGKNFIQRKITEALKVPEEIAESYLKMKAENKIIPQIGEKLNAILASLKKEWIAELNRVLLVASGGEIPSKIYIASDESINFAFSDNSEIEFQHDGIPQKAQAVFASKNTLSNFCKMPEAQFDASFAIETIYLSENLFAQ